MSDRPSVLAGSALEELILRPAGEVDLRRDLYQLVTFVQRKGLRRTRRENLIPKGAARQLAKLLSWEPEAGVVEQGGGRWSEYVSAVALKLGLVSYDTEGVYVGYTSTGPSFINNDVRVDPEVFERWLARPPLEKEREILDAVVALTPNEFFNEGTLIELAGFGRLGSGTGPAGRMDLPVIRQGLLALLAELEPGLWFELTDLVALVQRRAPHLILDPQTLEADADSQRLLRDWERESRQLKRRGRGRKTSRPALPPKPEISLEDLYVNFRECPPDAPWTSRGDPLTSDMPDGFARVEGRYLERFLCEVPFVCGLVSLAFRGADDPHGLDVLPPRERLRGVKVSERLAQLMHRAGDLNRVTVRCLPTFEVIVHAPSYPDLQLRRLESVTSPVSEDGFSHRLRLDRRKITARAASSPDEPTAAALLDELCDDPLPGNVTTELASWESRGEKVVIYEGLGLLELRGPADQWRQILAQLADLIEDGELEDMVLVRQPKAAYQRLEQDHHVPVRVTHPARAFAKVEGKLARPGGAPRGASKKRPRPTRKKKITVTLEPVDLMAYRAADASGLGALYEALIDRVPGCLLVRDAGLLLLPAARLPELRKALQRLRGAFEVEITSPVDPTS